MGVLKAVGSAAESLCKTKPATEKQEGFSEIVFNSISHPSPISVKHIKKELKNGGSRWTIASEREKGGRCLIN